MSFWTLATKADIGICGYANSLPNLFKELSLGMMSLLIPHDAQKNLTRFPRKTAEWRVELDSYHIDYESLALIWLEEILYKLEIENKFLVDGQHIIRQLQGKLVCEVQVSYIDAELVDRNLEIKAVTSHELVIRELSSGETYSPLDTTIPQLVGPAWIGNVIFDI